jgi:hypothetical protein
LRSQALLVLSVAHMSISGEYFSRTLKGFVIVGVKTLHIGDACHPKAINNFSSSFLGGIATN